MKNKKYFFDNPKNVKLLIRILFTCCFVLFALDLVIHRHTYHPWESFVGFYAIYGFLACVILVLIARELRKLVMRPEDYYESKENSKQDINLDEKARRETNG
jgi:hypothetical protein